MENKKLECILLLIFFLFHWYPVISGYTYSGYAPVGIIYSSFCKHLATLIICIIGRSNTCPHYFISLLIGTDATHVSSQHSTEMAIYYFIFWNINLPTTSWVSRYRFYHRIKRIYRMWNKLLNLLLLAVTVSY